MDWIALCVICMNICVLQARHDLNIHKLIEIIMELIRILSKRRNSMHHSGPILGAPRYPEHLPEAEPILPGHTLIRPAKGMLKSAVKFPLRDLQGSLVYGNKDNIGIAYGKNNERVRYSDFRKSNNILSALAQLIQETKRKRRPSPLASVASHTDEENDAREILDELDPKRIFFEENSDDIDFRRKKSRSKHRKRSYEDSRSSSESDSTSGSSEYERNPGNAYTIHKDKYKQNWLWNHFMDGDHMNLNPYAPDFKNSGPSGPDLFFGRKWWYFNQDDYKPMR